MDEIDWLVKAEQVAQCGRFIQGVSVDEYLNKIKKSAEFLTHSINGQCAGFVAFYCNDQRGKQAFITLLLVAPDFRGQKVASALLGGVFSLSRSRGFHTCQLEVDIDNCAAIKLYEKFGFRSVLSEGSRNKMVCVL
ncbi:GNAT family N-acetyltransferase [Pseudomonas sp. SK2]|uniref:GNAT family N-acetyltransferase n=1 Tax=Pseudomonas sp. SK2 TaxID=2841063 RepID=UPI00192BB56E|nr:GNAT family N-acetyltransferase [Pseudomonas sp. SK2]QQZ37590.1 GNAT family N-acetyltransferase [Pseudomonas sp. SK2]